MSDPQLEAEIEAPPLWCAVPCKQIKDAWARGFLDLDTRDAAMSLLEGLEFDPLDRPQVSVWSGGKLRLLWESKSHTVEVIVRVILRAAGGGLVKRTSAWITLKKGRWMVIDEEFSPATPKLREVLAIAYKTVFQRVEGGEGE